MKRFYIQILITIIFSPVWPLPFLGWWHFYGNNSSFELLDNDPKKFKKILN